MIKLYTIVIFLLFLIYTENPAQVRTAEAFPALTFDNPVEIADPNDGSRKLFVVTQNGIIYSFDNNSTASQKKVFLDISSKVITGNELGLLGLAFHPNYKDSGYFYINYTTNIPEGAPVRSVVSRFKVNGNKTEADTASEQIILEVDQPYANHNGGKLAFGPDGYLYISFGDGGSGGDPDSNAQDLTTFLGKILRIDVNNINDTVRYHIPPDNPFAGNVSGYKEEVFAYGLRNVWKFSFDKQTGELWGADVGQDEWEEINIIAPGGNYGWNIMEGPKFYSGAESDTSGLMLPVWSYGHNDEGGESITGGLVYRGDKLPSLKGKYIYADFISGRIWTLENSDGVYNNALLFSNKGQISAIEADSKGTLLYADYSHGKIMKIEEDAPIASKPAPQTLTPETEKLAQNYPNPFNPETTITFNLEKAGYAKLEIYNMLGKKIETLFEGTARTGANSFTWRSENMPSGVYFYKLTTESYSATKKMILEK